MIMLLLRNIIKTELFSRHLSGKRRLLQIFPGHPLCTSEYLRDKDIGAMHHVKGKSIFLPKLQIFIEQCSIERSDYNEK